MILAIFAIVLTFSLTTVLLVGNIVKTSGRGGTSKERKSPTAEGSHQGGGGNKPGGKTPGAGGGGNKPGGKTPGAGGGGNKPEGKRLEQGEEVTNREENAWSRECHGVEISWRIRRRLCPVCINQLRHETAKESPHYRTGLL